MSNDRFFRIADREITEDQPPFVVAEIGCNHGGSLEHCKHLFRLAAECGCDAVKLQKRDNKKLYTVTMFNSPYNGPNSFGTTYGEHREALEFGVKEFIDLQKFASDLGIIFFATAFDGNSVDFIDRLSMPAYKIASGDLKNIPLIRYIALKQKPVILSTGGGSFQDVVRAVNTLQMCGASFALLHCVSSYPNQADELNLSVISQLRSIYPNTIIGFSSHYDGVLAGVSAYHYGARIIEYHFTDSHVNKGTDHALSLQPQGMRELVHQLREAHRMRGDGAKKRLQSENGPLFKMEKSIYPAKNFAPGHQIGEDDIRILSPGGGIHPYERGLVMGKITTSECSTAEPLSWNKLR